MHNICKKTWKMAPKFVINTKQDVILGNKKKPNAKSIATLSTEDQWNEKEMENEEEDSLTTVLGKPNRDLVDVRKENE